MPKPENSGKYVINKKTAQQIPGTAANKARYNIDGYYHINYNLIAVYYSHQ